MNGLTYDGHDFTTLFTVGNITQQVANPTAELVTVPGRDGAVVRDVTLGTLEISVELISIGGTEAQRRANARTLASWLSVDSERALSLHDEGATYYMAVPNGPVQYQRLIRAGRLTVTFTASEPAAYGEQHSVVVPSGSSVTFTVGGNYPTRPTVLAASAVRSSSSLVWGIRLDGGSFLHVQTGTSAARRIEIDCKNRTCFITANRTVKLPTVDSDWFVLSPGTHVIANDQGSGECRVTWTERWL